MAITLSPEQQALLETFQADAEASAVAHDRKMETSGALYAAQNADDAASQAEVDAHMKAITSAQAFIDSLTSTPSTPGPEKKK